MRSNIREKCVRLTYYVVIMLLAACASELPRTSTPHTPVAGTPRQIQLAAAVPLSSSTGYSRTLPANSIWRQTGTIPEGDVYRIEDSVFTVEARHIHEAYIVVKDQSVVGYYLPVERAFSPLSSKVNLPTKQ